MSDFNLTDAFDRDFNTFVSADLEIGANICALQKVTRDPIFSTACKKLIEQARAAQGVDYAAEVSKAVLGLLLAGEDKFKVLYVLDDPDPLPPLRLMVLFRRIS